MDSIIVRFPDGTKEFRYPERALEEGDVIWHDGERYRIVSIYVDEGDRATAVVELASGSLADKLASEEGGIRLLAMD